MSDASPSTATLVLGEDIRRDIADRLGLTADELDHVPMAIEVSLAGDVEGFAQDAVRLQVRSILTSSPAFRSLPPESRKELAHDMVRVL